MFNLNDFIITIETPALLFPAVSLLFLSYTNRFLATGQLIRSLGANLKTGRAPKVRDQIRNLTKRMELIKLMQMTGALSLLFCTVSMLFLFFNMKIIGSIIFVLSLGSMVASLIYLVHEIYISTIAIHIELKYMINQDKELLKKESEKDQE